MSEILCYWHGLVHAFEARGSSRSASKPHPRREVRYPLDPVEDTKKLGNAGKSQKVASISRAP